MPKEGREKMKVENPGENGSLRASRNSVRDIGEPANIWVAGEKAKENTRATAPSADDEDWPRQARPGLVLRMPSGVVRRFDGHKKCAFFVACLERQGKPQEQQLLMAVEAGIEPGNLLPKHARGVSS